MVDTQFFDEPREQSQIKARIVEKYLWAWANVVIPTGSYDTRLLSGSSFA